MSCANWQDLGQNNGKHNSYQEESQSPAKESNSKQQFCIRAVKSGQGQHEPENFQTTSLPAHAHSDDVCDLGCYYPATNYLA